MDLSKTERSVLIRAPRARVWKAITDPAEFSAWFQVKAEGQFAPGARVKMTSTHPSCMNLVFYIEIADVQPERAFSWRWHPGSEQPPEGADEPRTLVLFWLEDEEGGTRVTVTETGFEHIPLERRAKVFDENSQGWREQMDSLAHYLAHGA
jgi:uncharacterized protein YndB with AHSA1/START domain